MRRIDGAAASIDELRNVALRVHLEWGPERGRPELERVLERAPGADPAAAQAARRDATAAASLGFGIVYDGWDESRVSELQGEAGRAVRAAHPWVDDDNLRHLLSQAAYYGWKG